MQVSLTTFVPCGLQTWCGDGEAWVIQLVTLLV